MQVQLLPKNESKSLVASSTTPQKCIEVNELNKTKLIEKGPAQKSEVCEMSQTMSEISDIN